MFIFWVKFVEIPKQIFGIQLNAINPFPNHKARCFSQSERALYGNFIIKLNKANQVISTSSLRKLKPHFSQRTKFVISTQIVEFSRYFRIFCVSKL